MLMGTQQLTWNVHDIHILLIGVTV